METRVISEDFSQNPRQCVERVEEQTRDLDISVLVNNVGILYVKRFCNMTMEEIEAILSVNISTISLMTRAFLPRLQARKLRSAIINLSSISGKQPFPNVTAYGATKAFDYNFSLCLADEVKDKIDVLVVTPGAVATEMGSQLETSKINFLKCTTQSCVAGSLRKLGRELHAWGSINHFFSGFLGDYLPNYMLIPMNALLMKIATDY